MKQEQDRKKKKVKDTRKKDNSKGLTTDRPNPEMPTLVTSAENSS